MANSYEAPLSKNVRFTSMFHAVIFGNGGMRHIINGTGDPVDSTLTASDVFGLTSTARLASYPPADTEPPTLSVTPTTAGGAHGWLTSASLAFTGTDNYTPGPTFAVQVDGAPWIAKTTPYRVPEGRHVIKIHSIDQYSNTSPVTSWTGKVDGTKPTVKATVYKAGKSKGAKAKVRYLKIVATDATSGVAAIQYRVDSGALKSVSAAKAKKIRLPKKAKRVSVVVTDVAGNKAIATIKAR